eukprot:3654625-Pleurochrysis_carterae.AAC.1
MSPTQQQCAKTIRLLSTGQSSPLIGRRQHRALIACFANDVSGTHQQTKCMFGLMAQAKSTVFSTEVDNMTKHRDCLARKVGT